MDLASKPLPSTRNILVILRDLYAKVGSTNGISEKKAGEKSWNHEGGAVVRFVRLLG